MPRTIGPVLTEFGSGDQPEFDLGHRLILRSFAPGDESIVHAAFTDPDIVRWHHFRVDDPADATAWIERTRTWAAGTKADWLILLLHSVHNAASCGGRPPRLPGRGNGTPTRPAQRRVARHAPACAPDR